MDMRDERIEQAIIQTNAKLLILDPLQAYLGENIDMNRANEARSATKKLSAISERTGCGIILIGHMNKGSASKAAYRGIGSVDFYAVARSVLLVARVPEQPNIRAIAQIKSNLALEGETNAFRLDENGFEWIGGYDVSVDELLSGFISSNKQNQAEALLKKLLDEHKSLPWSDIIAKGKSIGVSARTLDNAKKQLGITSVRVGKVWHWSIDAE